MKRALFYILFLLLTGSVVYAGQRELQYFPEGRGFVCENGWNRYSRALYGSHANWRLETSDRPLFATYDKGKAWNIQLHLQVGDRLYALDSTSYCRAYYEGGIREYVVTDEQWGGGELRVRAIAEQEGNHALWQFEAKGFPQKNLGKHKTLQLIALRRPISQMKMKRNGDLGTDPREHFEALANCPDSLNQQLQWDAEGTTYLRLVDNDHLELIDPREGAQRMEKENLFHEKLIGQLRFETPDPGDMRDTRRAVAPCAQDLFAARVVCRADARDRARHTCRASAQVRQCGGGASCVARSRKTSSQVCVEGPYRDSLWFCAWRFVPVLASRPCHPCACVHRHCSSSCACCAGAGTF